MISISSRLQELINEKNEVETSGTLLFYEYERLHCRYHSLLYKQKLLAELKTNALPTTTTITTTATVTNSDNPYALSEYRTSSQPPKLFIAIMSGFGNAATRDVIRRTWASKDQNVESWATVKFAMADPALLNDTTLQNQV